MGKNMLLKTNLLVCLVIVAGFAAMFAIDYRVNHDANLQNVEYVSTLTASEVYYRLESIFEAPINVSLTMANSRLLKAHMLSEAQQSSEDFILTTRHYLNAYKEQYGFDSVFLASGKTRCYYNFNGIDRILSKDNPENAWYYSFLESGDEYSLNVDNDEAAQNEITFFVNCRIVSDDGETLGVVGVGLKMDDLQDILLEYADTYGTDIYLVNGNGNIELAIDNTGWQPEDFFAVSGYPQLKDEILQNTETGKTLRYWRKEQNADNYVVSQYIPSLKWHLIVEHNTAALEKRMSRQLYIIIMAAIITVLVVTLTISYTMYRYNKRIIELVSLIEQEKHAAVKRELAREAEIDGLSGVYNKKSAERYITQMLADRPDKEYALFVLDVDDFKTINDRYGHMFGDFALKEFASIIRNQVREGDVVGRIGGDEFAVFLPVSGVGHAAERAEALSKALHVECADGAQRCRMSASIGVALAPRDGTTFEALYSNADTAMYETKRRSKNGFTVLGS